jgi:hypothetical protein
MKTIQQSAQFQTGHLLKICDILLNRRDLLQTSTTPEWTAPEHAHVRGANYYQ